MKHPVLFAMIVLALIAFGAGSSLSDPTSGNEEEPELAELMGTMQRYLHKLDLSVQGNNAKLASFYLHELEEVAEEIIDDVPVYDGFRISEMTELVLVPRIQAMETVIKDGGDMTKVLKDLIVSCHGCHVATEHEFIVVTPAKTNPFNQEFRAEPESD